MIIEHQIFDYQYHQIDNHDHQASNFLSSIVKSVIMIVKDEIFNYQLSKITDHDYRASIVESIIIIIKHQSSNR